MSGIAGIVRLDGRGVEPRVVERMIDRLAHRGPDGSNLWCRNGVGLGHVALCTTPESVCEHQPVVSRDGDLALVSDARIDNRIELQRALATDDTLDSEIGDAKLILASYRRWDTDCAARLLGDFSFALWDQRRRRLFCARDHIGVKSFYYHRTDSFFAFASEIKALFAIPEISRELDERRIATHILLELDDRVRTFYREVSRLPAAHWLSIGRAEPQLRRYWSLDPEREIRLGSDQEYETVFRETLREAISCRLRSVSSVGSTLSGGLDSSTIACTAREILQDSTGEALHTFSAIFPGLPAHELRRIDERSFIEEVLGREGIEGHFVRADELGPLDDLEQVLRDQDEPHVPINLYLHRGIYESARRNNVGVILDGFDGDTTVSHGFFRLAALTRGFQWPSLLREAKALAVRSPNPNYTLGKVLKRYAVKPLLPAWLLGSYRWLRRGGRRTLEPTLLEPGLRRKLDLERRSGRDLDRYAWLGGRHEHLSAMDSPLIQTALELADKAASAHGLEARYPFFDRRLMELCLALPSDQKLRDGWTRSILRRSQDGLLPASIQWRVSKADLSPNVRSKLRETCPRLLEGLLKRGDAEIARFVDLKELTVLSERFRAQPTNSDALKLFSVTTLAVWLQSRPAGGAEARRSAKI